MTPHLARPWIFRLGAIALALAIFAVLADVSGPSSSRNSAPRVSDTGHGVHGSAPAPGPNSADIGFAQDMIVHHQQAIVISDIVLLRGSRSVKLLAEAIKANQLLEIGQMQGLLYAWDRPLLATGEPMTWMTHEHHHDASSTGRRTMPGMATQRELNSLQELAGRKLALEFLRLMIRHHQGALPMAAEAVESAGTKPVIALAQRMAYEQATEIAQMKNIRAGLK